MSHSFFSSNQNRCDHKHSLKEMEPIMAISSCSSLPRRSLSKLRILLPFCVLCLLLRDITLPLRSFHLKCSNASVIQPQDINRFVHAAAQRGIENLNLEMSGMVTLPRSIFNCRTLVVLHLQRITLKDLSQLVVDFPLLKKLHLSGVLLERAEYIIQLLSGCPILEEFQAEYLFVHNKEWLVSMNFIREKLRSLPKLITANITKSTHSLTFMLTSLCRAESQHLRAELVRILWLIFFLIKVVNYSFCPSSMICVTNLCYEFEL
jgi:hypothetical protein